MAQTSKNAQQSNSEQEAIDAGNKAMEAVMQDLFSVMNDLGKQQTAELATENEALTTFLSAESDLSNATTRFAGPSPRFDAPTWEGSPANPKRASYKKQFTPIIHKVLTTPTVQSDEMAIAALQLELTIKETFQQQAQSKGLVPQGKGFPKTLTDDTIAMQWVADTIITLSGIIPEDVQTTLANSMIARVTQMTSTTLYNNLQLPDYWRAVEGLEESGGSTTGVIENAVGQVEAFLGSMWSKYGNVKSLNASKIQTDAATLLSTTISAPEVQDALKLLTSSEQQYFKSLITSAAADALAAMPTTAPTKSPQKQNYATVQSELNSYKSASNTFTSAFPTAAPASSATWDGDFWAIVQQALVGSPAAEAGAVDAKQTQILNALHNSYKTLPRNPSDPTAPITNESEITTWIETTVANLATKQIVTQTQADMLNSGLIDEVMKLFPIPDKISFYETFQDNLKDALLNLPSIANMYDGTSAPGSSTGDSEPHDKKHHHKKSKDDKKHHHKKTKDDGHGLRHIIDHDVSPTSLKAAAQNVISNLKPGQTNPVAQAILDSTSASDLSAITKQLGTNLLNDTEDVVDKAISNVFITLSEQGVQGQMISTSYDYQLIYRISNYTSTLLTQLDKHYDKDVPANSSESIAAAQSITAASVSYRNYANDLDALNESYQRAAQSSNANSGRSTKQLDLYFNGNKSSGADPAWAESLVNISDAIYSSGSSEEALILTSEYDAVQLAANAAGFDSNLSDEFLQERSNAEAALNNLLTNTQQLFKTTQTSYDTLASDYFSALATYTEAKEAYLIDEAVSTAYDSALAGLTDIIESGNIGFDSASLATLPTNS